LSLDSSLLASSLKTILGLNKRKVIKTKLGNFYIDLISNFGSAIIENGIYEPEIVDILFLKLKESNIFIDVGANEGYFSTIASKIVGNNGCVIAIEPQKRMIEVINKNLEINNSDNVYIENTALSDESFQKLDLYLFHSLNTGASSMVNKYLFSKRQKVLTLSMEDLFKKYNIEYADLIKIDVEGFEPEVINGAKKLLGEKRIRAILIDFHESILEKRQIKSYELEQKILSYSYYLDNDFNFESYRIYHV
jgi:FkbM family methyltransferase